MAPSPGEVNIFFPLAVGLGTTFGTVFIHALALVTIIHFFVTSESSSVPVSGLGPM